MKRTGQWWINAYRFLEQFDGYELVWGSFLDGMYERFRLKDKKTNKWLGPEIELFHPKNKYRLDGRELL